MIVPSMTVQEVHKEVFDDIKNLRLKVDECRNDFKKTVLNGRRYPLTKSYVCTTKEKRNSFTIDFTARKRSDWKKPLLSIWGIYTRPEGKYAFAPSLQEHFTTIYPPHFFQRYRERILKDESLEHEDVMRHYFRNDWGFTGLAVNKDFESVYHFFEKGNPNDRLSIIAATSQGYCFGERQGNVTIMKTIIAEDMLFENQKYIFSELKNAFTKENKERFGVDL